MKVATNWADEGLVGGFPQSSDFRLEDVHGMNRL